MGHLASAADVADPHPESQPPPGWAASKGILCTCLWRWDIERGHFELLRWDLRCLTHPFITDTPK